MNKKIEEEILMNEQNITEEMMYLKYPLPFMIGFFLLNTLFLPVLLSTILFIMHISLQAWVFPLSVTLSGIFTYIVFKKDNKKAMIAILCGIFCLAFALFICAKTYDFSWDGNAYHKSITGLLKHGWNPLTETFYSYAKQFPFLSQEKETWYDAYPKATELWGAVVYATLENIEIGKAFNILSMIALLFICWSLLHETNVLKKWQSFLCAAAFSINVVIVIQSLTYYNDGFLWEMILLFLASLSYLTFYENGRFKNICYYFIFLSINMGLNTKFSGVIFFGLSGFAFFIFWLIEKWKKYGLLQACKKLSKNFFVLATSVIFSLVVTGSTSYVINIIRHKNPVYTMIGEDATEMIVAQISPVFKPLSNASRFICSLFSQTNNQPAVMQWKFPFTFYKNEILQSQLFDTRIGGWGIFFSAIFLISVVFIVFYLVQNRKKHNKLIRIAIMLTVFTIVSIIVVPGLFWARYSVGLYYIPAIAMVFLCKRINRGGIYVGQYSAVLAVLCTLLFLNHIPSVTRNIDIAKETKPVKTKLESLKYVNEIGELSFSYITPQHNFSGRLFNLYDEGITDFESEKIDVNKADILFYQKYENAYSFMAYSVSTPSHLSDYIKSIDRNKYLIFISAKDDASAGLTEDVIRSMRELGLKFDMEGAYRNAYVAIVGDAPMYEEKNEQYAVCNAGLEGVEISMLSAGYTGGNTASIKFDGKEYSKNQRGLNIVIYNKELHHVTDSVYVDLYENDIIRR